MSNRLKDSPWAAWHDTWLLIKSTPKFVVFSFPFLECTAPIMALQELEKWQCLPMCLAVVDEQESALVCEFAL